MASDTAKRRFAPVPVETSIKSSRGKREEQDAKVQESTPRRFAVEPVEQSVHKSNRTNGSDADSTPDSKTVRKFVVEPVETSSKSSKQSRENGHNDGSENQPKKPRKFAVEPVETSVKSNRNQDSEGESAKPARKFAVQPVETSSRSNHKTADDPSKPKARFAPQPVETVARHHRAGRSPMRRDSELDETPAELPKGVAIKSPPRKFAPQLIDTSSRSRKASDENIPVPPKFRTDVIPGHMVNAAGEALFPDFTPKRRAPLPHERRKERTGTANVRSHSFLCPDLETIESSESEVSEAGSPTRSTSPSTNNESPLHPEDATARSSKAKGQDGTGPSEFSKYMLDLEAKRAEQVLQEQALAAFANSDFHEPVQHYVDEDEMVIDDRPTTWDGHDEEDEDEDMLPHTWRQATTRVDWELQDMKRHQEELERAKEEAKVAAAKKEQPSPWWNPAAIRDLAATQADSEMSQMLNRARPPMLGDDLKFPRSQSPEPARFDITQGSHVLRSQMCYLTEQAGARDQDGKTAGGLWGGAPSPIKLSNGDKGLWAGLCSASHMEAYKLENEGVPSGLITPANMEPANPFDETLTHRTTGTHLRPPTPPHSRAKLQQQGVVMPKINAVLNTDAELDELMESEYPDTFVTQVFNYLSLGYPSLARSFDDELAKITMIPVTALRHDDEVAKTMPKGYLRIGEDFTGREDGSNQDLENNECVRWRALKLYIREWARQEKGMVRVHAQPWGAAARKGSWAW